ncbi:MAG: cation:dicarboxylate symporter family transporter, partial [Culicoidibacterales bacterium]
MFTGPFFEQFLVLTSPLTLVALALLGVAFYVLYRLQQKQTKFSKRMFIALTIGLGLGIVLQLVAGLPTDPMSITWL